MQGSIYSSFYLKNRGTYHLDLKKDLSIENHTNTCGFWRLSLGHPFDDDN
jgi:hypothetical protein